MTGILSRVLVARFDSGGCLDIVDGGCSCAIEVVYECRLRCVGGCSHGLKYCPDVVAAAVLRAPIFGPVTEYGALLMIQNILLQLRTGNEPAGIGT